MVDVFRSDHITSFVHIPSQVQSFLPCPMKELIIKSYTFHVKASGTADVRTNVVPDPTYTQELLLSHGMTHTYLHNKYFVSMLQMPVHVHVLYISSAVASAASMHDKHVT